ncbi:amidase [filamentous cyanobacterium CCP5]|nr:amidase [filamentous cyanobacterium CCP5]
MNLRSHLLAAATALTCITGIGLPVAAQSFEPSEATIADIQSEMESGRLTAEALVQLYLDRIEAYDDQGPGINALITVNPNAVEEAVALDAARAAGEIRGPLHGIPIILKDNYDTADLPTTAGSDVLAGAVPPDDGFTVQRLREAGAIILGKANMSEFALSYGRLGYSSLGGLTLNPYNLGRNASGSSSGTAAAIAANFAVFGTGTDTAGSIRGPAAVTGLVGIKPTLGLVSRDGIVPLTLSFDVAGPMARTVTDAAIALGVIAAPDPADPRTLESETVEGTDYTQFLSPEALVGARIGIARDFMGGNPEVDALTEAAIATLDSLGATVVPVEIPEVLQSPWGYMAPAVTNEFQPQIEAYLATLPADYPKTLSDLLEASQAPAIAESDTPVNPARLEGFEASLASGGLADTGLLYSLSNLIPAVRQSITSIMGENGVDAIIYPTMACPASPVYTVETDDTYVCNVSDPYAAGYLANITGFPDITVPMGFTEAGLPLGLSFMGIAYSEPTLLGYAYAFEQATQVRTAPPTTPPLP